MPVLSKPIPPLYTVYILRSTVRHASLYIGSTPNPPRRLKQHNGEVKGGAARTARSTLRPWEMVGLMSGFPSMVAALKFEWALTNPHLSLHIPSASRLTVATERKRNGRPKRPRHSLTSILSNLHLLLRVPSFSRWPLRLHFFAPDAHQAWVKWCSTVNEPLRDTLEVVTDFVPRLDAGKGASAPETLAPPSGVQRLPLDYTPMRNYIAKTTTIVAFEREGHCVVCNEHLPTGEGFYAVCSNDGCEGVGHVACWSKHLLAGEEDDHILPVLGHCPSCHGRVDWGEMMREVSLRMRGQNEVEKLLRKSK